MLELSLGSVWSYSVGSGADCGLEGEEAQAASL